MIWSDGSIPFLFNKGGSGILAYCSFCGTEVCAILQALHWSWQQHQQVCAFFSTLVLFLPLCPLLRLPFLSQTQRLICQKLSSLSPSLLSSCNGSPNTYFSQETTRLTDELARRETLFLSSSVSCSHSRLSSRIHSCLFSDWRRAVSSKLLDAQVPSVFTDELVLPCHARCAFSRLRCSGHSLL